MRTGGRTQQARPRARWHPARAVIHAHAHSPPRPPPCPPTLSYGREEAQARASYSSRTIYIGNLAWATHDGQLSALLSMAGPVEKVIMGINRLTKKPCGFAFAMCVWVGSGGGTCTAQLAAHQAAVHRAPPAAALPHRALP